MRFKFLPIAIAVSSLLSSGVVLADQKLQMIPIKSNVESISKYWTPERMKSATPMALPMANHAAHKKMLDTGSINEHYTSSQLPVLALDQTYPYSTVGKLFFTTPAGDKTCSGAVIGNRVVVTAAHCLHSGKDGPSGWYGNWLFVPAYRDGNMPFQKWSFNGGGLLSQWLVGGGTIPSQWDYGMLTVADQTINGTVQTIGGVVGQLAFQVNSVFPNHAYLFGYPGNLDNGEKMHQVSAHVGTKITPNNLECGSDMNLGAGGGPWIQNLGTASTGQKNVPRNVLVGVTSYGFNDTTSLGNGTVALDNNFTALYNGVCNQRVGNC